MYAQHSNYKQTWSRGHNMQGQSQGPSRPSRCAEDPLEEAVQDGELRLMLHSFPGVWVSRETAGLLTNKSEVVSHDCWYRNMAVSRLFTLLGSKPKTRTGNKSQGLDLQGKGQGLGIRGRGLNFQGQGHYWLASRPRPCPR